MVEENEFDDEIYDDTCQRCGGEGWVVVCIDDVCRAIGECIHGDGEVVCPVCGGDGIIGCTPAEGEEE